MSLMGYRSTLLRSTVVLVLFYVGGSVGAFYFLGPQTLAAWIEERGLAVAEGVEINALNAAAVATEVVIQRIRETGVWILTGAAASTLLVWTAAGGLLLLRKRRARARGAFRGLSVSLSTMPTPPAPDVQEVSVDLPRSLPAAHQPLLRAIMGYLKVHEDAWCGDGHNVGLLQHTLHVLRKALDHPDADELLPLVAAAHDMGKATAYEQRNGEWIRVRYHDKEGARILAAMPEWWALDNPDRTLVLYAVKYEHAPRTMPSSAPGLSAEDIKRLERLIEQIREVDGLATAEEKQAQLEDVDVEALVIGAFLRVLPQLPFQVKDLPKGTRAAGWRTGDRLFLIEHRVRDLALAQMDNQTAAALGGDYRATGEKADFTRILLPALAREGWLVTEASGENGERWQVEPEEALWHIRAGKMTFHGVFAVDLPPDYHHYFPARSPYSIAVTGPLTGGIPEAVGEQAPDPGSRKPRQPRQPRSEKTGSDAPDTDLPTTDAAPAALLDEAPGSSADSDPSPEDLAREALAEAAEPEESPPPAAEPESAAATEPESPDESPSPPTTGSAVGQRPDFLA